MVPSNTTEPPARQPWSRQSEPVWCHVKPSEVPCSKIGSMLLKARHSEAILLDINAVYTKNAKDMVSTVVIK